MASSIARPRADGAFMLLHLELDEAWKNTSVIGLQLAAYGNFPGAFERRATIKEMLSRAPALKALAARSRTARMGSLAALRACAMPWSLTMSVSPSLHSSKASSG